MFAKRSRITKSKRLCCDLSLVAVLSFLMVGSVFGQSPKPAIRLVKQDVSGARLQVLPEQERALVAKMPDNFYHFGSVTGAEAASPQWLTLEFSVATQITRISSTPDFKVLQGGTCEAGRYYQAESSCQLLVQFTPQGAGHRLGKVTVNHTASETPTSISLLAFAQFPVVSFVPSTISTVPATTSGGKGVFSGARNLAVDSGDVLYIADTGNNGIADIDSSGALKYLATGYTAPLGVTVDTFGEVYFTLPASNLMYEIYDYGPVVQINGTGTAPCTYSAPCTLSTEALGAPGLLSTDGYNNLFLTDSHQGAALVRAQPLPATVAFLYDPFPFQTNPVSAFAVDRSDNLYSVWANGGDCEIVASSLYDAANSIVRFTKVVGGHTCGFSGDGGQAAGAEMGGVVGQVAFDLAGNLYFTDTSNSRVRRVDAFGIIRTIAGNGSVGNSGDSGPATAASLDNPLGVAVDSQGQVYVTSQSSTTGSAEVVRKVGPTGSLAFGSTKHGTSSATRLVNVANTGTNTLTFIRNTITGTNPSEFTIDPNTTNCDFAAGNFLPIGQSCQIGVIFKPAATAVGTRSAVLNLVDNAISGVNIVNLSGIASTLAVVKFTSPLAGTVLASGANVMLAVSVSANQGPAPTGKVNFSVDGSFVASASITSGKASVNVGALAAGDHTVLAAYTGDKYHPAAKASEKITVSQ